MPQIKLCFLWHMHQPLYKDLITSAYKLPWARLHALKDYYGMVKILDEFPLIRQTFNLVPSLLLQIEDYASGRVIDEFLEIALKPAERLNRAEKEFALRYFFQANEQHVIGRYPRYAELFQIMRQHEHNPGRALDSFSAAMLRDLQVLSQLAWFDEEVLAEDREIGILVEKGRLFTLDDQALIGRKESQALNSILKTYRDFADRGQIEISTSAFYHPILPLVCDSNIAAETHPYLPLPSQFAYPDDAEEQLRRARTFITERFGRAPHGLWPSEGSVSDQTFQLAAQTGFQWIASDNGILARTLDREVTAIDTYKPYRWQQRGSQINCVFRDRSLSDLIGFVYAEMDAGEAAKHFLQEVHKAADPILQSGREALVGVILDGENAWESYPQNGRPFLRELYGRISSDKQIAAMTMSDALATLLAEPLTHVFPGSWIDASFDIWIGAEEDNHAWENLLRARKTFDNVLRSPQSAGIPEENKLLAQEELLIAEGSDWNWWYGPEHASANRAEFDQLYRDHLANVYRLLKQPVPADLDEPILRHAEPDLDVAPGGLIQPTIDGVESSRIEWANSGRYRIDSRPGTMHSQQSPIQELQYGTDGQNLYLRVGLTELPAQTSNLRLNFQLRNAAGQKFDFSLSYSRNQPPTIQTILPADSVAAALVDICEVRVSLSALQTRRSGDKLFLRLTVLREDLPIASLPPHGELELRPSAMAGYAY